MKLQFIKFIKKPIKFFFLLLIILSVKINAQNNDDKDEAETKIYKKSKILSGFYIGSYFANKYSASTYDGYGFDVNGNQNSFLNSFMYQKIKNVYGGGLGQFDQIASALGVDQGQWQFNESDMPINMRYVPAIMLGFNFKIPVSKNSAFIFNLNGSKLSIEGNFTMTLLKVLGSNPAINSNIKTFAIKGTEKRLLFQLGYQKIFGTDDNINFFGEIGFNGTLSQYNSNTIYINELQIDLTYYLNQNNNPITSPTKPPTGFGLGAYAGLGLNINLNSQFTMQLLYSPSHEKINIGNKPTLKLQNSIGVRLYYKI